MSSLQIRRLAVIAATSVLFLAGLATAQGTGTGGPSTAELAPPGGTKAPAKEAIDACVGKAVGDKVQFSDAKGKKRKWVCIMVGDVLAARSGVATPAHTPAKAK
jgi:hypothetical protein